MSKEWRERFYISSQSLWDFFDVEVRDLELSAENPEGKNDTVAAMLYAKREMLNAMMDYLREHEDSLGKIAERWGLEEKNGG